MTEVIVNDDAERDVDDIADTIAGQLGCRNSISSRVPTNMSPAR
jgi:plasmid stabilization system protein ParE